MLASVVKNIFAFAFVIPTSFFSALGRIWPYRPALICSQPCGSFGHNLCQRNCMGWGENAQSMEPHIADQALGVFYGAFVLFAATPAPMMSGAVI